MFSALTPICDHLETRGERDGFGVIAANVQDDRSVIIRGLKPLDAFASVPSSIEGKCCFFACCQANGNYSRLDASYGLATASGISSDDSDCASQDRRLACM